MSRGEILDWMAVKTVAASDYGAFNTINRNASGGVPTSLSQWTRLP